MPISLTKNYKEAAEVSKKYLKNFEIKELIKDLDLANEKLQNYIEVIGDWEYFSLEDMDRISWRIKFEFYDIEAVTDDDIEFRGRIAMLNPELAGIFTGKTSMLVYRGVKKETTIIEKVDRKVVSEKTTESVDWIDFTKEWLTKMKSDRGYMLG